jgi:hypothetical protein
MPAASNAVRDIVLWPMLELYLPPQHLRGDEQALARADYDRCAGHGNSCFIHAAPVGYPQSPGLERRPGFGSPGQDHAFFASTTRK